MRVTASQILREAQTIQNRNQVDLDTVVNIPVDTAPTRSSQLAHIEDEAVAFAQTFLLEFELPTNPEVQIDNLNGFENTKRSFQEVVGVAKVNASFYMFNQQKVRFTLEIPVRAGSFVTPSIVRYNNKRHIVSQEFFDSIVSKSKFSTPHVHRPLTPSMEFTHDTVIERSLFSSPEDPSGWSMLLTERY